MRPMRIPMAALATIVALASCGGEPAEVPDATGPTGVDGATTSTGPSGPTASEPTDEPTPAPEPVAPEHGGRYWAVYLAVGDVDSPQVAAALDEIEAAGWPGGFTSIGCDRGAGRIIGGDEDLALVGVYFGTEADAIAFLATQQEDAQGPVRVRTYCLD